MVIAADYTMALWIWRRRVDWIGVHAVLGFAMACAISALLGGNALLLKVHGSLLTGTVGLVLLISVVVGRPLLLPLLQAFMHSDLKQSSALEKRASNEQSNIGLPLESAQTTEHNRETFFRYDAGAVGRYRLDSAALKAAPTRIVLAGGREGRAYFPHRCAVVLASRLGTTVVEFPGNHAGFVDHPREFAARLQEVLGD
jgi:hypothetical protein